MPRRGDFSFTCKETNDPYSQYLGCVLASKAVHPQQPVPDIPVHLSMLAKLPPSLLSKGSVALDRLRQLFPLQTLNHKRLQAGEPCKHEYVCNNSKTKSSIKIELLTINYEKKTNKLKRERNLINYIFGILQITCQKFNYLSKFGIFMSKLINFGFESQNFGLLM